mmetsp:Transcript_492/g.1489  ORF Transcript_492/g.1489 Transcript_492/m.1489 type:complete len:400 (+) Transcript_492:797-1996(+)
MSESSSSVASSTGTPSSAALDAVAAAAAAASSASCATRASSCSRCSLVSSSLSPASAASAIACARSNSASSRSFSSPTLRAEKKRTCTPCAAKWAAHASRCDRLSRSALLSRMRFALPSSLPTYTSRSLQRNCCGFRASTICTTNSDRSMTRHSCRQMSNERSNGVRTSPPFCSSSARPRRQSRKASRSAASNSALLMDRVQAGRRGTRSSFSAAARARCCSADNSSVPCDWALIATDRSTTRDRFSASNFLLARRAAPIKASRSDSSVTDLMAAREMPRSVRVAESASCMARYCSPTSPRLPSTPLTFDWPVMDSCTRRATADSVRRSETDAYVELTPMVELSGPAAPSPPETDVAIPRACERSWLVSLATFNRSFASARPKPRLLEPLGRFLLALLP